MKELTLHGFGNHISLSTGYVSYSRDQPVNIIITSAHSQYSMEARKKARLSQKKLKRIAGQLMNVDIESWGQFHKK